jgi:hypothetical protein
MIRFCLGLFTIIAGVAAAEGSVGLCNDCLFGSYLGNAILISTAGVCIMLWGLSGMAKRGELQ